jgi:transcriptional/translational regulatory protein YebC/TACO1
MITQTNTNGIIVVDNNFKILTFNKSAEKMLRLIDVLEDLDDVQEVYSNADISEDVMEQVAEL